MNGKLTVSQIAGTLIEENKKLAREYNDFLDSCEEVLDSDEKDRIQLDKMFFLHIQMISKFVNAQNPLLNGLYAIYETCKTNQTLPNSPN